MALAEKRICEHTDATTISSADEFIVDSMANGTRNITMTNLENQILSTDTYSALSGIGDGTITGSIADIDSNLNNLTYDSTTNRLTMTGNTAFSGTIDSSPTAGSGNAVSSGGTKTYVDSAVSQLNAEIGVIGELKTWTPKLYDYTTYKRDLPTQKYVKVNKLYVMFLEGTFDYSDISTMIQIRNLPCQTCVGGCLFLGSLREASLSKGIRIQGDGSAAYPRPNVISSDFGTASSAERNKYVLFGYDS